MPRPVFNIEQYELRGHVPEVFTKKQRKALSDTLSRANGQIDWAAQLLGFHGDKTWGRPVPTIDGDYNWQGLPETMNEKRQLQVGAFGVYNKNLPYDSWPAPFNRSQIRAVGDATISIFERDGATYMAPFGQGESVSYNHDPVLYVGAEYEFDAEIDIQLGSSGGVDDFVTQTNFFVNDQKWTRLTILQNIRDGFFIRIKGSSASTIGVDVLDWTDSSDWNVDQVRRQFLGVWGNKGASLSLDFSFDALDLHGFDEQNALSQASPVKSMTPELLLWTVGLKPTIWTPFETDNFGFKFGDCAVAYPDTSLDSKTLLIRDQTHTFSSCYSDCEHFVEMRQIRGTKNEDCDFTQGDILSFDPYTNFVTNPDGTLLEVDDGECVRSPLVVPGVESFEIEFNALTSCSLVGDPCIEWVFDPALDNGDWETQYWLPDNPGPWAIADDGEYDTFEDPTPLFVARGLASCDYDKQWTGFDDGFYDTLLQPDCIEEPCVVGDNCFCVDLEGEEVTNWRSLPSYDIVQDGGEIRLAGPCSPADSGTMDTSIVPDIDDNDCAVECSVLENGSIISGDTIYTGPVIVTGGLFPLDPNDPDATTLLYCVTDTFGIPANYIGCDADNCIYGFYDTPDTCDIDGWYYAAGATPDYSDCNCLTECCAIDNELYTTTFVYTGPEITDGGWYLFSDVDPAISGIPCSLPPLRVNLVDTIYAAEWTMLPSLRNTGTPLRPWKSQVLSVPEEQVPALGTEFWNYLVADENRGPQPEADFRYYVRLPLEYQRNGKEWNRAVSVCDNQSYFSALPEISQTHSEPDVIRPVLYAEDYWRNFYQEFITYYDEDFLVSTFREDPSFIVETDFEDSSIGFELDTPIAYDFASVSEYDPFDLRAPNLDGSWRGKYYVNGIYPDRSGSIENDLEDYKLIRISTGQEPIYDKCPIELPTIDFPDSPSKASLKDYVVCYAYFATDFSASDDPVFDPEKQECWRSPTLSCNSVPDCDDPDNSQTCQTAVSLKTNTAYRLHEYGPATSPILLI